MQYDIPPNAKDELSELTEDELDFIERELFYAFDEAYSRYHQEDAIEDRSAIVMYERALETVRAIRNIRDEMTDEELEMAKDIHDNLT